MKTDVIIPKMGANITEAKLLRWFKKVNDHVEDLEPLFEVETSKAVFEIEAEAAGTLVEILHETGTFPTGTVVAHIESD